MAVATIAPMRIVGEYNLVRWKYTVGMRRFAHRLPIYVAEAIGFCVAEIRLNVIPPLKKLAVRFQEVNAKPSCPLDRAEPKLSETICKVPQGGVGDSAQSENKKYTYDWAVQRMQELENQGIADVVSYFNNEMTDWWLAPDGMMEQDADFEGIALAIEERWHC